MRCQERLRELVLAITGRAERKAECRYTDRGLLPQSSCEPGGGWRADVPRPSAGEESWLSSHVVTEVGNLDLGDHLGRETDGFNFLFCLVLGVFGGWCLGNTKHTRGT